MAGAQGRLHKPAESATRRRSARRRNGAQDDANVPDAFQDLLLEEQDSFAAGPDEDARPLKKRKTARHDRDSHTTTVPELESAQRPPVNEAPPAPSHVQLQRPSGSPQTYAHTSQHNVGNTPDEGNNVRVRQTIVDSDESDDSDMDWEDAMAENNEDEEEGDAEPEISDVSITFGGEKAHEEAARKKIRRRAITSVDKKRRLEIHKMHVLCLLYHVHRRNAWCSDGRVQSILRKIPSPKTLSNLVPNPEFSQYQASKRFMEGMNELKIMWSKRFLVTAQGMYRPRWAEADAEARPISDFDELDDPMDLDDFRTAASKLEGSQDVGAQLFCALLRGVGIDARLVCSLQCLPFASAAQPPSPQRPSTQKKTIVLDPYNTQNSSPSKQRVAGASRGKRPSRLERALGERHSLLSAGVAPKQRKKYHTAYPVYWVEAFNSAHQKWVPIDPLSTFTVNAPEKLEPPLSFAQNSLVYAIAFDEDYTAKDVTRRYAKAFNAKTRKFRVDSTPDGERWWKRTLKFFKRSTKLDRDQVEDAALARKEAGEGIPKNVQDFKNHPVYVLERHLRHNQVIHPLNRVGKVNVGTSMNPKMEPIYQRKDVHIVRSADKWYRMGRDVEDGEQPLKHAKPKKGKRLSVGPDMDVDEQQEEVGAGLYAEFQTELYVPPPVVRGRVPRNAYGNLDLYVPSMCPPGGVHIRHKLASKAARIVGVDSAEAVTGFSFKGRHGTAIVQGVVVAQENGEAVEAVIDAMLYAQEEAENQQRRTEALRLWRRFCLGLRIAQRVNAIEIDGETGPVINVQDEIEKEDKKLAEQDFAGGFFPDEGDSTEPTARGYAPPQVDDVGAGFVPEEDEDTGEDGGFFTDDVERGRMSLRRESTSFGSAILSQQQLRPRRTSSFGGGFTLEGDDSEEGGFSLNSASPDPEPSLQTNYFAGGFVAAGESAENDGGGFMLEAEPTEPGTEDIPEQPPSDWALHGSLTKGNFAPIDQSRTQGSARIVEKDETIEVITKPHITVAHGGNDIEAEDPSLLHSSPSDAGSLLLEDPEDEDADPDWLVDAT